MELRHLRYFQIVAETLSFSRASERLHVAQPTISRQIAALEQELGCKLFVRTTSRVRLTDAGRYFQQEVDRLLGQLAIAATGAREIARGRGGELNLGSDWRILVPQIHEAVLHYRAAHPKVTVNFVELPIHAQIDALREGRIHLGFVYKTHIDGRSDIETLRLGAADLKLVVSSAHRLASAETVEMRELSKEPWLRLDEKTHPGYRALITQLCQVAGFTPKFGRLAHSIEGMLALAGMGDGVCLVTSSLITRPNPGLRFIATDCAPFEFYAAWSKDNPPEPRSAFLRILKKTIADS